MFVVAIHDTHPTDGSRAAALAAVLGVTAYNARPRVISPGPCVVSVSSDEAAAVQLAGALRGAGFATLVRDVAGLDRAERVLGVRTFSLGADAWTVAARDDRRAALRYADLLVMVAGMHVVAHTSTETVTKKKGSLGRAVMTGGLSRSKKIRVKVEHTEQERQRFLHVYTRTGGVAVVLEAQVDYAGLGESRQATRAANFEQLVTGLRERAPQTPYDDRLLTVAGQRQLLGPSIDAEEHVDLASALVASWVIAAR
jgi:hypothetical protein